MVVVVVVVVVVGVRASRRGSVVVLLEGGLDLRRGVADLCQRANIESRSNRFGPVRKALLDRAWVMSVQAREHRGRKQCGCSRKKAAHVSPNVHICEDGKGQVLGAM